MFEVWFNGLAKSRLASVVTVTGILVTGALLGSHVLRKAERENLDRLFEREAQTLTKRLDETIDQHIGVIEGVRSFFDASDEVTRTEFHTYVVRSLDRHPGLMGLHWVPKVAPENRDAFQESLLADSRHPIEIQQWSEALGWTPGQPEKDALCYPVRYAEGEPCARLLLGWDLSSHPAINSALIRSQSADFPVLSPLFELPEGHRGALILAPVYPTAAAPATAELREALLQGFIAGVVDLEGIVTAGLPNGQEMATITLWDRTDPSLATPIFQSAKSPPEDTLSWEAPLMIAGRDFLAEFHATTPFLRDHRHSDLGLYLGGSLLLASLVGCIVWLAVHRSLVVDRLVELRTRELRAANDRLHDTAATLRETKEALELSNLELRQFAYVASHDLQSPLRTISSFVNLLEKRYEGQFDEKGKDWIARIVSGTDHMSQLIQGLLAYSRVDSKAKPLKPLSLDAVVQQVLELSEATIKESGAVVTVDPLPRVTGDQAQLHQVFQNLISNGIKYCEDSPRVRLTAEEEENRWIIRVTDNGIGIPEDELTRIFDMFARLHSKDAYPGTGMGLAICRRIVERHGGRIRAESEGEGKGSTFVLSFPKDTPVEPDKS